MEEEEIKKQEPEQAPLPEERAEAFRARILDLSGGAVEAAVTGESFQAVPV